jgi:hypothetical protein
VTGDRYLRPDPTILGEGSLIPPENEIRPAPNRFTHRLEREETFSFRPGAETPDGTLAAGTEVVLLRQEGDRCHVVDGRGIYVTVRCSALRPR